MCADIGSQGATCDYMQHSAPVDYNKSEWDDMRFGQFCISADAFADFKSEIEKLCSLSNDCAYDTQAKLDAFFARAAKLHQ